MNPKKIAICSLFLVVTFHAGASYAARVEHGCDAEKFIPCPSFRTSRTIGEHTPIIDNHVAGLTRSKGKWTITVGYGPAEKCAKVSLYIDRGGLEIDRHYERVFRNGGGVISDDGTFFHKIGQVESGLRIHNSTCRVPAPQQQKTDTESKERQALEEERERQELEEERERLALEEERERLALEEEQERLALEEEQRLEEERERLALEEEQERLALEEERERQRLAQQRRERERQRLAQQRSERERQRLAQEQGESGRGEIAQQRREQKRGESRNS